MIGIVFIILVATSRLYLRVHWLSDIMGAVLI
ncbi:phosphatase PAP2 family protein, partial [Escherichia coli]